MSVVDMRTRRRVPEFYEPPVIDGKPPPHDLAAEAAIIAASLARTKFSDAAIIDRISGVLGKLGAASFYNAMNATLWHAIVDLHAAGIGVDAITIAERLRGKETWNGALEDHLRQLTSSTPAMLDRMVVHHAAIVARKARMRRVIAAFQEWAARGYGEVPDDAEYIRDAAAAVSDAARDVGAVADAAYASEAEIELLAEIDERTVSVAQGNTAGYPSGIEAFDRLTGGFMPRGVCYLSAPEKGRKSTVAAWAAVSVAESSETVVVGDEITSQRRGVVVFPFEMSKTELQLVASCQRGNVNSQLFTKGGATQADREARARGAAHFAHLPIVWDDRPGLSIATLRSRLREARSKLARGLPGRRQQRPDGTWEVLPALAPAPLRFVVIDTIQLFGKQTPHKPSELQAVVDEAGAEIKSIAGKDPEFARVSWLIVSHENKEGDLRDSGALKNHLTQWIKLDVHDNETRDRFSDPNLMVATFKVHRWRFGEAGGIASAWIHKQTGAVST